MSTDLASVNCLEKDLYATAATSFSVDCAKGEKYIEATIKAKCNASSTLYYALSLRNESI
jgi:hypothetical protein